MVTAEVLPESRVMREGFDTRGLRVAVSGASGLVGSALVPALRCDGHRVSRFVRRPSADPAEIFWDHVTGRIDFAKLEDHDAMIHLAGENVAARRWNETQKGKIRDSRVLGTRLIATSLAGLQQPPRLLIVASAIGYYGDRGAERLDEESTAGEGFLADTCQAWEQAANPAEEAGIRVPRLRIGVVLSPAGGALKKMLPAFRLGLGGRLGSGSQYMSWIALDDLVEAIRFIMQEPALDGPINAVAPSAVTNAEFTRTLARVVGRPAVMHLPRKALEILVGEMAQETLLASAHVVPRVLENAGFRFRDPLLEPALKRLLGRP